MPKRPYLPLRGIRVLSFEVAFSLPAGTRTLAELGAEVVRVAGPPRAAGNYIAMIDGVFLDKPCIGINLKHEAGREVAGRLVAQADIVCQNFTPEVMSSFSLAPSDLLAIKPNLVVLQLTGYGTPGPWAEYPAYGPSTEAAGGLNAVMGAETDDPVRIGSGVFSDQLAGRYATLALLAGLQRARATGEGQIIDLSMTEAITTLLGGDLLQSQLTGRTPARPGNRDTVYAPQGNYRCAGEDEFIAISVKDDAAWQALVRETGDARLTDSCFSTVDGRRKNHDAIDALLDEWTRGFDKQELAERLQAAGVAAGPVRRPEDSHFDAHLRERQAFQRVRHDAPVFGFAEHPHVRMPWVVDGRPRKDVAEIRYTGADNATVLRKWLGMKAGEVRKLAADGALLGVGRFEISDRNAAPGTRVDKDAGERLGLARPESQQ